MPSTPGDPAAAHALASALPNFLVRQRWFGNHSRTITDVTVVDSVPLRPLDAVGVVAEVEFSTGEPQRYFVPIATGADGMGDPRVASRLVRMILGNERLPGTNGVLVGRLDDRVPEAMREARSLHPDVVRPLGAEQSNSSTVIDERAMLKVLRRVDPGIHPEVEILEHLTARRFPHTPTLYGTINHRSPGHLHPTSVATLTQFVPSDGDMSKLFRSEVARFVEHAAANPGRSRGAGVGLPVSCPNPSARRCTSCSCSAAGPPDSIGSSPRSSTNDSCRCPSPGSTSGRCTRRCARTPAPRTRRSPGRAT